MSQSGRGMLRGQFRLVPLTVLLGAWVTLTGCPSSLSGAGGTVAARVLRVQNVTGPTGTTLTVAVLIDRAGGVAGGDLVIIFNAAQVTAVGASTTALTSGFQLAFNAQPGILRVSFASATSIASGQGALVNLQLRLDTTLPSGTCATITLRDDSQLFDANGAALPLEFQSGQLCVP